MAESTTSIFSSTGSQPSMFSTGVGAVAGAYSAYKSFTGPDINYDILKLRENQKELEAQDVELKTQQAANNLRDQFSEAAGGYQYGTARRNIKVGEGSAGQNIENSARDLGIDEQTMTGNAKFKADQLRAEGDRLGSAADSQREVNKWERLGGLMNSLTKLSSIDWGKKTTETEKTKDVKTTKQGKTVKPKNLKVETVDNTDDKTYGNLSNRTSGPQGGEISGPHQARKPNQFNLFDNPGGEAYHGGDEIGTIDATKMAELSPSHKEIVAKEMAIDGDSYMEIAQKLGLDFSQVANIINLDGGA